MKAVHFYDKQTGLGFRVLSIHKEMLFLYIKKKIIDRYKNNFSNTALDGVYQKFIP